MLKRLLFLSCVSLSSIMTMWAQTETTYSPTLDVNFRTGTGNTSWQTVKNAADEGNTDFELTSTAGFFALQKYTVPDLANATKLVLTLTVGSKSGVDAVRLWSLPITNWTAETGVDDIYPKVKEVLGVELRTTEGTANEPLVKAAKVADSNPAKATLTITGTALATIKANASADGTFTLLLTNDNLTNSNNKRSYLSSNIANVEANRPTLVATIETPSVVNKTTGVGYSSLAAAWAALGDGDTELEVYEDQTLTGRLTWSKAHTLTITPKADITIKGHTNQMWFLVNINDGVLNIGSDDYCITLDGENKTFGAYAVTKFEKNAYLNLTNVKFQNFNLNNAGRLVEGNNNEGFITLKDITITNCKNPETAFIKKLRVNNDKLILKGYLNIDSNCEGTAIYAASETQSGTVRGRIKLDDENFTASNELTINWGGDKAAGAVVVINTTADNAAKFQLTDNEWTLERKSNGDLVMAVPATPTAKIGEKTYADLQSALADVAAGETATITLLADQDISSRINIKNVNVTITGGKTIKRATGYTNGLVFLTVKPDEDMTTSLTFDGVVLDGQNVESTAAFIEASNNGTTTLKDVTMQNVVNTNGAAIVNKSGGKLVLKGTVSIPSVFVGKPLVMDASEATISTPIVLTTDSNYPYGQIVYGAKTTSFTCDAFRLSQQMDGVYLMPKAIAASYSHPALLHTASDITTAKNRLSTELYANAYAQLEAQSGGEAAGAVESLKRMDKNNWGPEGSHGQYADYNNYTRAAQDAKLAYMLALRYQLKGSDAAATAAVNILNNWASVNKGFFRLTGYANNIPDPNEYLMTIQAYQFANAAELLRDYSGWQSADQTKFKNWIREAFADVAIQYLSTRQDLHYWLNWDLAALNALVSVGVYCDDKALVDFALDYINNGKGTGNKANAVAATHTDADTGETLAQCQESGRDQGHSTLDISLLGVLGQTAANANVGTDLFADFKILEMAEYVGKYNLKDQGGNFVYSTVPFTEYTNGEVTHTVISSEARGTERPCWELIHAYAVKNNQADKYTAEWVNYFREKYTYGEGESSTTDELGFGTLMYGAEISSTDGIDATLNDRVEMINGKVCYNLQGQRVDNPTKGLYIVNGKKILMK